MNTWHNELRRESLALLHYKNGDINFGRIKFKHRIDKFVRVRFKPYYLSNLENMPNNLITLLSGHFNLMNCPR